MKTIGLILTACFLINPCKVLASETASEPNILIDLPSNEPSEQLPNFPIEEWKKHATGLMKDPFFLQDEIYEVNILADALPSSREKTEAQMLIRDSNGRVLSDTRISIKLRGYSSMDFPKKQYGISPIDEKGEDLSLPFLGMPKAEDWVLSAPYNDKSLVRDILTYNLSNLLGRYAPRTRIVRLSFTLPETGTESKGIYVLTEKNTFGKGRIEIPKKNASGTSFQATFDHPHEGDNILWRQDETHLVLEYPSIEKIKPEEQKEFLDKFMGIDNLIRAPQGADWDNLFEDKLDLASTVDFFVIQELGRNIDGYRLSSGIYSPPKGKIFFGPVWDFNLAYGNAFHENGAQYNGWRAQEKGIWFGVLLTHPKFCAAVKKRWTESRLDGNLSNATIFNIVDKQSELMKPLVEENFEIWPSLGLYLWPNPYWLNTWEGETNALKSWISLRTEWLDQAVTELTCTVPNTNTNTNPDPIVE
jgi:hypothetical protein